MLDGVESGIIVCGCKYTKDRKNFTKCTELQEQEYKESRMVLSLMFESHAEDGKKQKEVL